MIEPRLLRELGWSDELIEEVSRVAETIRETPTEGMKLPEPTYRTAASTAAYADAVVNNTSKAYAIQGLADKS